MEGRCQCGAIQFKTPFSAPLEVFVCHCTECRHQSSSAFGITAVFPRFDMNPSDPSNVGIYSRQTLSGRKLDCYFCRRCGSRLIHKCEGEEKLGVKGGCLSGLSLKDATHIWCKEAITAIPAGARSFSEEPVE